ncbi:MAG: chemotaxis protein CheW [Treponema sp.]|uniref:chemotaxis protein CheW n=1 Tax=Treponema sp. TaxID=166 RepID=UPI001B582D7E|nr:chemotaxis protein CheW [Treponema sp.]MBP5402553.1 chemotaxis protein CheW [Treponema sp.]MBR5933862.1 chemotaxis protein CheW [Treponema sp.]
MTNQLLTFTLDNNVYAFEVFKVQEVLEYSEPVKIPCASPYIKGLINSRGNGISVTDLRQKFSLPEHEPTKDTRIIVVEVSKPTDENPDRIITFGAVTDSVLEVLEVDEQDVEPPPKFGNTISPEYISGLTKKDDKFIIILNEKTIFSQSELPAVTE